jgi:uncharacterized phage-like protein YoqJ
MRNNNKKPELIRVAVTGPRPENMAGVPVAYVRSHIRDTLEVLLEDHDGLVHAYSGMARGIDTIFATQALRMGIQFHAVIPFQGFDAAWTPFDQQVLNDLLEQAREVHTVCDEGSKAAYQARNIWMVNHCDLLMAYNVPGQTGGTANCMSYARSAIKPMRSVDITKLFPTLDKSLFTNVQH